MIATEAVLEREVRSMGGRAHIVVHGGTADQLDRAVARLAELERRWSRFVETSDITRANRAGGAPVPADEDTLAVVARALDGWRQTGGRFDITVLPALLAAGYTDSVVDRAPAPLLAGGRIGASAAVVVDYAAGTLSVPPGTAIDLGAIGKGFAADVIAEELVEGGATGALVNVGGDLRVAGRPLDADAWRVGIADPRPGASGHVSCVRLASGGVATSGTTVRRWQRDDGSMAHHVIDPRTGRSADTEVATATVLAADAATAEVYATMAMLLDAATAMRELDGAGLAGLLVDVHGEVHRTVSMGGFLEGASIAGAST